MKPVTVYAFRHGETDWNRDRRFQGHTDISLNEVGKYQAKALAWQVREASPETILSSDLMRAKETTEIVNQWIQVPVIHSSKLRECKLGDPEGKTIESVIEQYGPQDWGRWRSALPQDLDFSFPNGETKRQHLERMLNFIQGFLLQQTHLERIAISTHGGSLLRLVHHCIGAPDSPIAIPNCALYRLTFLRNSQEWRY